MNSMTGFGRGTSSFEDVAISLEISSVNRRNLEMSCSLPKEWYGLAESAFMGLLKEKAFRGKFHVSVQLENTRGSDELSWDNDAVKESLKKFKELSEELHVPFEMDTDMLIKVATLHRQPASLASIDDILPSLKEAFSQAFSKLLEMRAKEGEQLRQDLLTRVQVLESLWKDISNDSQGTVKNYRELLFSRLKQAGLEMDLEDERVLKEISLFSDRCDISEEITRLESHLLQMKDTLVQSEKVSAPIGRKQEFILQEVNREFNTIGSKANNIRVSKSVIEAKNEIERIREQLQNVE